MAVDECRLHAHVEPLVDECGGADEPHRHPELVRSFDVLRPHRLDSLAQHVVGVTRAPNATVARIAIFAAASAPDTSSVGSASAYPSRCASARAPS